MHPMRACANKVRKNKNKESISCLAGVVNVSESLEYPFIIISSSLTLNNYMFKTNQ